MDQVLSSYSARRAVARLKLAVGVRKGIDRLVALLDEDGYVPVATIHVELFALLETASANRALARLVESINAAAREQTLSLTMCLSTDKKGGAKARRVWFEGPRADAPTPVADELDSIAPAEVIEQRAVDTTAPTAVILTFNEHESHAVREQFAHGEIRDEQRDGVTYHHLGMCGAFRVVHRVSGQGQSEAQAAAAHAIAQWSPAVVITTGIACGIDKAKQAIGDVVVAEALCGYELARVEPGH